MLSMTVAPVPTEGDFSLTSGTLRHLPLVREAIDKLGIAEVIGGLLPRKPRMVVSDAECVTLMILNVLHGRVALYHMADWLAGTDAAVLLGPDCPLDAISDTRLAETLDRIFELGTDEVLSAVVERYLASGLSPSAYAVHQDTTTIKLYGAYGLSEQSGAEEAQAGGGEAEVEADGAPDSAGPGQGSRDEQPVPPVPRRGYSKDHRPDLLQLVYGLSVQGAIGIPLCVSILDGNTSDPVANRFHIDRLSGLLPPMDEVTLVADCKLCDAATLGQVLDANFHFVTLVPRTFTVREALVEQVRLADDELPVLATASQRRQSDPERHYRGRSFQQTFSVHDSKTDQRVERSMRFLVVDSPGLAEREEGAILSKVDKERQRIDAAGKRLLKQDFACKDDAERAVGQALPDTFDFHDATAQVEEVQLPEKRERAGRPRKGEEAPTRRAWKVVSIDVRAREDVIARARFHARHFVLITDHLDVEAWPDARILSTYREQHIVEGHTGFRWLKGPAAVAPAFIKTRRRIAALGLFLIVALMVRNYFEWAVRSAMAKADVALPNLNNQPTKRPSAENVFYYFRDLRVARILVGNRVLHTELQGMRPEGEAVLRLLGWSVEIFTRMREKIGEGVPAKAGM